MPYQLPSSPGLTSGEPVFLTPVIEKDIHLVNMVMRGANCKALALHTVNFPLVLVRPLAVAFLDRIVGVSSWLGGLQLMVQSGGGITYFALVRFV